MQLIPKVFHFVWVGESVLPEPDKIWMRSWQKFHPDWQFVIWCEIPENVVLDGFESRPLPPLINQKWYNEITRWVTGRAVLASRSDIIRYEVILNGGVYLDTDVECFGNIEARLENVSLFRSDEWGPAPGNYMFGAVANHPGMHTVVRELGPHLESLPGPVNACEAAGPPYLCNQLQKYSSDLVIFPHMLFNPLCAFDDPDQVTSWPKVSLGNHHYAGRWYDRVKRTPPPEFRQ